MKNKCDIILCDYSMPNKNGAEILSIVKENSVNSNTPFIFISGIDATFFNSSKNINSIIGANKFLSKPFSETELIAVIKNN
jgi:response regulator RpfG family c-di-GMP phosphodiesterase